MLLTVPLQWTTTGVSQPLVLSATMTHGTHILLVPCQRFLSAISRTIHPRHPPALTRLRRLVHSQS